MSDAALSTAPALRVLLRGIVDYAGLFPPASLDMASAAAEYAKQRSGSECWMLGRFVLPAARLTELEQVGRQVMPVEAWQSWALSALLSGDVEEDIARAEQFNERHRDARLGAVMVDTVELKVHTPRDVARAAELLDRRFDTYMEGRRSAPAGRPPTRFRPARRSSASSRAVSDTTWRSRRPPGCIIPGATSTR
jgi:hypothetical protein